MKRKILFNLNFTLVRVIQLDDLRSDRNFFEIKQFTSIKSHDIIYSLSQKSAVCDVFLGIVREQEQAHTMQKGSSR